MMVVGRAVQNELTDRRTYGALDDITDGEKASRVVSVSASGSAPVDGVVRVVTTITSDEG